MTIVFPSLQGTKRQKRNSPEAVRIKEALHKIAREILSTRVNLAGYLFKINKHMQRSYYLEKTVVTIVTKTLNINCLILCDLAL